MDEAEGGGGVIELQVEAVTFAQPAPEVLPKPQDSLVRKYSAKGVPANFSPSRRDKSSSELRGR